MGFRKERPGEGGERRRKDPATPASSTREWAVRGKKREERSNLLDFARLAASWPTRKKGIPFAHSSSNGGRGKGRGREKKKERV